MRKMNQMNEALQKKLILVALESASSLFGKVIAHNKEAIIFENKSTGERKKIPFCEIEKTLNEVINSI